VDVVLPMRTWPVLLMRTRSTGTFDPAGVVLNTRRPGMELVPGVPSTAAEIKDDST
jgi:hypothetical protein